MIIAKAESTIPTIAIVVGPPESFDDLYPMILSIRPTTPINPPKTPIQGMKDISKLNIPTTIPPIDRPFVLFSMILFKVYHSIPN